MPWFTFVVGQQEKLLSPPGAQPLVQGASLQQPNEPKMTTKA